MKIHSYRNRSRTVSSFQTHQNSSHNSPNVSFYHENNVNANFSSPSIVSDNNYRNTVGELTNFSINDQLGQHQNDLDHTGFLNPVYIGNIAGLQGSIPGAVGSGNLIGFSRTGYGYFYLFKLFQL
jgi:hypothetical protein